MVAACFVLAVFAWGVGFYGPGVYLHALQRVHGWSATLVGAAVTLHFVGSALVIARLPALHARFGVVATTRLGAFASAGGIVFWASATAPWHLVPAALLTAIGWSTHSAAAINAFVSPWFDRRRPAALALAYNGASIGGVLFTPFWALLIDRFGFPVAGWIVAALGIVVIWPLAAALRGTPAAFGLHPDNDVAAPPPRQAAPPTGRLLRQPAFRSLSAAFAVGLVAQMGLLTTLFAILAPALGVGGASLALSGATLCAIAGRTAVAALLPPGADRRRAAMLNFALQAIGSVLLALGGGADPALLLAGLLLFGLGIGNLLSLPPLIAQAEWPAAEVGRVVALFTAINQAIYAFGPALFGAAFDAAGPAAPPALAALLQAAAALLLGRRRRQ